LTFRVFIWTPSGYMSMTPLSRPDTFVTRGLSTAIVRGSHFLDLTDAAAARTATRAGAHCAPPVLTDEVAR
jgi:hypothetical protein